MYNICSVTAQSNMSSKSIEVLRMTLMIIYIATCLDNLPSPGKLLLITFHYAS